MTLASLRARRLAAGLSQEALAHRAGCSASYLRFAENGYACVSDDLATRLARALDCGPEDLQPVEPIAA